MSQNYHTPIGFGQPANSAILNAPIGELDQAFYDAYLGDFHRTELSVQPVIPSTSRWKMYPRSNDFYVLDDSGVEQILVSTNYKRLIAQTVLTGSAASITLSGISGSYRHLLLVLQAASDWGANTAHVKVRLNADATAVNYYTWRTYVTSGGRAGDEYRGTITSLYIHNAATGTLAPANWFSNTHLLLLDYASNSKYKYAIGSNSCPNGTTTLLQVESQFGHLWLNNTDAVSEISLAPESGAANFIAGTRYSLYGIP